MTRDEIRGVVLTLETLLKEPMDNQNEFIPLIIEGKPISYWINFIAGYMVKSIELNNPNELTNALDLAPVIRDKMFCCLNCRCRFEANPGEYVPPKDQYDYGAYCICPECGCAAQEE